MMRLLFHADSAAGNGAPSDQLTESKLAPAPAASTPSAAPPAATTVIEGTITEDTVALKKKLADTEAQLKKVQTDHASITDEHQRYKDATEARRTPAPPRPPKTEKPFRIGKFLR